MTVTETTLGAVAGRIEEAWPSGPLVDAYRGIPFAAPPVGPLRFRPPDPARPWTRTMDAASFGPAAPQPGADPLGVPVPGMHPGRWDEDCLTLNVWRPHGDPPPGGWPVMFWVHGGAFTIGASSLPTYDGARLCAEQAVVVVSANYRLGALGFLYAGTGEGEHGLAPNCGLADQLAALHWVRENAAGFGADPQRTTMFGESAGAGSILHLLAWPAAAGLFRRAILQSPGAGQLLSPSRAETVTERLLARLGAPADPDALRAVPASRLLVAQQAAAAELAGSVGAMPFHPVSGAGGVPADPVAAVGGGWASGADLVVGTTEDEMRLFRSPALDGLDHDHLAAVVRPTVSASVGAEVSPRAVAALVSAYEEWAAAAGGGPATVWAAIMTDGLMRLPAERLLRAHAGGCGGTYAYSFAWRPTGPAEPYGAFHAVDLPFTFGTFDRDGWGDFLGAGPDALTLGERLRASWGAFAREGSPPGWPAWSPERRTTMVFGPATGPVDDPLAPRREAWRAVEAEVR